MRVAIVGAGAVGLATASFLHQAGVAVSVLARSQAATALRRDGLGRRGIFGEHRVPAEQLLVVEDFAALTQTAHHSVIVCTKTHTAEAVAEQLAANWRGWTGGAPAIVLFHNGWGSAEHFTARIRPEAVYNARLITGFRQRDETTSEVTVHADRVLMGSLFGGDPATLAPLAKALDSAGLPTAMSADIGRDLWAKMLYNCALNPLGALRGVAYGDLAAAPATRNIIDAIVVEVFAVMRAAGYATHWTSAEAYLLEFYENILPATAAHESSMLQDLRAGRRTEIDALAGAVVGLAQKHGVPAPLNAALRDLVVALEQRRGTRG